MKFLKPFLMTVLTTAAAIFVINRVSFLRNLVYGAAA